jgi:streptogramin lyase
VSSEKSPIAASWRLVAAALVLAGVARPGVALAGSHRQTAWTASSAESISPGDITVGADRNLWFPETGTNRIGRITTAGEVAEFTISDADALGRAIAPGPDGRIWVLGSGLDGQVHVWAVDTSGLSDEIAPLGGNFLGVGFLPTGITAGPDGNVWNTGLYSIVRVSPAGQVTEFSTGDGFPTTITAGPDARLWFVESVGPFVRRGQGLGRIATDGTIEQVSVESRNAVSMPSSVITGPDGNLWFADNGYSEIVRATVNPVARTQFPFVGPTELAAGPDGNIWITSFGRSIIARMIPGGALTEFDLPAPLSNPLGIVAGPDGNLWFTQPNSGTIARITLEGVVTAFPIRPAPRFPINSPRITRSVGPR